VPNEELRRHFASMMPNGSGGDTGAIRSGGDIRQDRGPKWLPTELCQFA
jgi:hypothetical protein